MQKTEKTLKKGTPQKPPKERFRQVHLTATQGGEKYSKILKMKRVPKRQIAHRKISPKSNVK